MNQTRVVAPTVVVHGEGGIEDLIYEAAVIPERWPAALRQFSHAARYKEAVVLAVCGEEVRLRASSTEFESFASEYFRRYGAANERTRRLVERAHPGFLTDLDIFSVEEMLKEPVYRDYTIPRGYGCGVATVIDMPTGDQAILHAEGEFSAQPLDAAIVR